MLISFKISDLYLQALTKIAKANGMTENEYAESQLKSFLTTQAEGYYRDKFNKLTLLQKAESFGDMK
jgi:hypothetical protein